MANTPPTREVLFRKAAEKLRADFEELSVIHHGASKGSEGESLVREFLSSRIPNRFGVEPGFIIDKLDKVSRQMDAIIYDAFNCPRYRVSDDASFFPSDNVAGVLQIKSTLDGDKLGLAFENIESAKNLAKLDVGGLEAGRVLQTAGYIFAFRSSLTLEAIADRYHSLLEREGMGVHPDIIVVLDRGIVSLVTHPPGVDAWAPLFVDGPGRRPQPEWQAGVAVYESGDHTLDLFMRLLLPHLSLFRHYVDHPGFDWTKHLPSGGMKVRSLGKFVGGTMFESSAEEQT